MPLPIHFHELSTNQSILLLAFAYSALFGIAVLSIMPHQEPRFLLPIFFPVIFILSDKYKQMSKGFWSLFILFNISGLLIFGILHQGGIIPVISHIQHEIKKSVFCSLYEEHLHCQHSSPLHGNEVDTQFKLRTNVIFYKTYMPPQHLFTIKKGDRIYLVDLAGASLESLEKTLTSYHGIPSSFMQSANESTGVIFGITDNGEFQRTLVVAPSVVDLGPLRSRLKLIHQQWPHLDTDYLSLTIQNPGDSLYLNVYTLLNTIN
ncbi:alpha 1,2 mannosyltransferase [Basidiobolus ranarum]|uniref:Mannosyltransferase n=1 Tax=Basidiobolus ranarum TaxID=34480 RepID=A0ABR2W916_9FUNG